MNYLQFRNAAYRHLVSCKQMLKDANNSTIKKDIKDRLCLEIYYLGGYTETEGQVPVSRRIGAGY